MKSMSGRGLAPFFWAILVVFCAAGETTDRTVVDMTDAELRKYFASELRDLDYDADQEGLKLLLNKVGEKVEAFFRDFSNTSSKEKVHLQRFGYDGREQGSATQEFNYLILSGSGEAGIRLEEDRRDDKGHEVGGRARPGFFLSSGFAGLSLYFHPNHQPGSRFRYLGRQASRPRNHIIAFAQKPEAGDYLCGYSDTGTSESTGLLLQGLAWIDPDTYQIVRMRTNLLLSEHPVSLREQKTDIRFTEVHFAGARQSFWLPHEVLVTWRIAGSTFRNRHRYSDYKLFSVESYDKISQPQIKK